MIYAEENIAMVYDHAVNYIETLLAKHSRFGLISKESIGEIVTNIICMITETNPFSILEDISVLNDYTARYMCTHIPKQPKTEKLPDIDNIRDIIYSICVMDIIGYSVDDMCKRLNQPVEEITYAINIIKSNKIIEWM